MPTMTMTTRNLSVLGLCAAACVLAAGRADAQCSFGGGVHQAPTARDEFGTSVAVWGDIVVVGAPLDDITGGFNQGSATVFRRIAGQLVREGLLLADDRGSGDRLGAAAAISGDYAAIGAPNHANTDPNSVNGRGAVYLYKRVAGVWLQDGKVTAPSGAAGDFFGQAVALDGDTLVVGAPFRDAGSIVNSGVAYIFRRNATGAWVYQATLSPPTPQLNANYGASVAVSGTMAVVGEFGDDALASDAGAVHVYRNSAGASWPQEVRITPADGKAFDQFGVSVGASGDSIIVGAWLTDQGGTNTGSAYVFVKGATGGWTQQAKLLANPVAANEWFGNAVAISADTAIVGSARYSGPAGANQGAAYSFKRTGSQWAFTGRTLAPQPGGGDFFGSAVAVHNGFVGVGAHLDDIGSLVNAGAVTAWGLSAGDCNSNGIADACEIASGAAQDCNGNGVIDSCEQVWTVEGDFNRDCLVNNDDLALLLSYWGTTAAAYDLTRDGHVNSNDLSLLLANWGSQRR